MKFIQEASLKDISLAAVAIKMWDHVAGKKSFPQPTVPLVEKYYENLESQVVKNVPKLKIPAILKLSLLEAIRVMGWELYLWREEFRAYILTVSLVEYKTFSWTPLLAINREETAKFIIKKKCLNIFEDFKLACSYCLKTEIFDLWKQHDALYLNHLNLDSPTYSFWVLFMVGNGDLNKINEMIGLQHNDERALFKYSFEYSVSRGNESATRYYIQTLTNEERHDLIPKCIFEIHKKIARMFDGPINFMGYKYAKILCFLLSNLTEDQQQNILKENPFGVLKCLFDMPQNDIFLGALEKSWKHLSEDDYYSLLYCLTQTGDEEINRAFSDYQKKLDVFWQTTPKAFKDFFTKTISSLVLFEELFGFDNEEAIHLILEYLTSEQKRGIFLSHSIHGRVKLLSRVKPSKISLFIDSCQFSKEEMLQNRKELVTFFKNVAFPKRICDRTLKVWDKCTSKCPRKEPGRFSSLLKSFWK